MGCKIMTFWVSDNDLDAFLDKIALCDEESICSAVPDTWFSAHLPNMWQASTAYALGDTVRPPTENSTIYECIVAGTTGANEPGWLTTQDATFTDGGVTWKAHESVVLAATELSPADFTKEDYDNGAGVTGRKLTKAEKVGITTFKDGVVSHTALLQSSDKTRAVITEASTTVAGDNNVVSGRTTVFQAWTIVNTDPVELV